jgi:3-dehydroquinate synthase
MGTDPQPMDSGAPLLTVPVDLGSAAYQVLIGRGALGQLGAQIIKRGFKSGCRVLVVSNAHVSGHYGETVRRSLEHAGLITDFLELEAGEVHKTPATVALIHDRACSHQLERGSLIVALGGGVVGDMAGFAAATWLRGIGVVQVPTTLLAMVDAAIGGKTGVNHAGGKNLIGAFHQPQLVLIDPETLATLPPREVRAGMAEVIKYGVIGDPVLVDSLEERQQLNCLEGIGKSLLLQILRRSAAAKARVVATDEREGSLRAILNYGHTLGHVVETLTGYERYLHGEAVAIGMAAAGELSLSLGLWSAQDQQRQLALLERSGLPVAAPDLDGEAIRNCLLRDKKVRDGRVRFVLPTGIGSVVIRDDIDLDQAVTALRATNRGS